MFHSVCPVTVPKDQHTLVGELPARINYGVLIGNFEIDFSDGEVRYKTGTALEDTNLTESIIWHQIHANTYMMNRYLPVVVYLLDHDALPEAIMAVYANGWSPTPRARGYRNGVWHFSHLPLPLDKAGS